MSMEATALPAIVICIGIIFTFMMAGLFGIAVAVDHHAVTGRDDRGAGCVRPGDRQRRRHRRDGRPAARRAQDHRRAGRRRQHHQGGDQGLCDRLGGSGVPGVVRRLHPGPVALLPDAEGGFHAAESVRGDRPVHRRPAALPVRRHGHDRGRPRGRLRGGGSAAAIPRDPRHHGRHRQAGIRQGRGLADPGGDQGNDRSRRCCRCWRRSCCGS